jgi:hypothetical protein
MLPEGDVEELGRAMVPLFGRFRKLVNGSSRRPRAYPRLMISEPVRLGTPWMSEQPAILEDISVGGACVRSFVRLRPGDTVNLFLSLGPARRIEARARVVYATPGENGYQARYGMRFVGLTQEEAATISDYVVEQRYGRRFGVRPPPGAFEREV